jgi:hypothetical protein
VANLGWDLPAMVLTEPSLCKAEHNGAVPGGQREDAHPPRYESLLSFRGSGTVTTTENVVSRHEEGSRASTEHLPR